MFTNQSEFVTRFKERTQALVDAIAQATGIDPESLSGYSDSMADSVWDLANCAAMIAHRGELDFSSPGRENATSATQTLRRPPLYHDTNYTPTPRNGWAQDVAEGAAIFRAAPWGVWRWAKAQGNWNDVAGDDSFVDCLVCVNRAGTMPTDGPQSIRIYLPRYGTGMDPSVYTGNVIPWVADAEGGFVTPLSPSSFVGQIIMLDDVPASVPTGWEICTQLGGRNPIGYISGDPTFGTPFTQGGALTVSGSGTATTSTVNITISSITIDSATTGVTTQNTTDLGHGAQSCTVNDSGHTHGAGTYTAGSPSECTAGDGTAGSVDIACGATLTVSGSSASATTGITVTTPTLTHAAHNHGINDSGHTHTVSGGSLSNGNHSHTVTISDVAAGLTMSRPPYLVVVFLRRTS